MQLNKGHLLKTMTAIPLCLVLYCFDLIPGARLGASFEEVFPLLMFGEMFFEFDLSIALYIRIVENITFVFLFDLLFSDHLAGHFRYSCVYVFTRIQSRQKWYLCRATELAVCAFLYSLLYTASIVFVSIVATQRLPDRLFLQNIAAVFLFAFLLVTSSSVAVNILKLKIGTATGVFTVAGILFILIGLLMRSYQIPVLFILNPLACLNLFRLTAFLKAIITIYDTLILAGIVIIGAVVVKHYDVALFDPELN